MASWHCPRCSAPAACSSSSLAAALRHRLSRPRGAGVVPAVSAPEVSVDAHLRREGGARSCTPRRQPLDGSLLGPSARCMSALCVWCNHDRIHSHDHDH
eukprot:352478-Chlamydomonas_euryale.AAC.5